MRRLALILLFASAPAMAMEPLEGSHSGTSTMGYMRGQSAMNELRDFGACYATSERKDALKLVATKPGSAEEVATYRELFGKANQYCLHGVTSLSTGSGMVRGAIAEGLYRKKVPVPAELAVAQAPAVGQVHNISEAAICYAGGHAAEAQSLVNGTKPGSKEEYAALEALWGNFVECIPQTARKSIQIDVTLVRFRIAEALWKLGMTPDQMASAVKAQ